METEQQPEKDNYRAEAVGKGVGMVLLMPLNVSRHERSFGVHVRLVMAGVRIEEAHERTVRNQRHYAHCLIFDDLEPSDPEKDDNQAQTGDDNGGAICLRRDFENGPNVSFRSLKFIDICRSAHLGCEIPDLTGLNAFCASLHGPRFVVPLYSGNPLAEWINGMDPWMKATN